jgi:hypothetical protein
MVPALNWTPSRTPPIARVAGGWARWLAASDMEVSSDIMQKFLRIEFLTVESG